VVSLSAIARDISDLLRPVSVDLSPFSTRGDPAQTFRQRRNRGIKRRRTEERRKEMYIGGGVIVLILIIILLIYLL
jgi:hypothetical protein